MLDDDVGRREMSRLMNVSSQYVQILYQVAIFYGAVLRGDLNKIRIGGRSVVLDRAVIHTARYLCFLSSWNPVVEIHLYPM